MSLLQIYLILNILNVIIQTIKSLVTVKCGKTVAAIINGVAYGLYQIILVYAICDLPLYIKVISVGLCNLIGVFIVKFIEEKLEKTKLWKVEATISREHFNELLLKCKEYGLTYSYIDINKYYLFNFYCPTKQDSKKVHQLLNHYGARYFVSESKKL